MSRMTYIQSWKSHRLTHIHGWALIPQIGRPLSRIVIGHVPLVYLNISVILGKNEIHKRHFSYGFCMCLRSKFRCGRRINLVFSNINSGGYIGENLIFPSSATEFWPYPTSTLWFQFGNFFDSCINWLTLLLYSF
jgi:hypothetical protein